MNWTVVSSSSNSLLRRSHWMWLQRKDSSNFRARAHLITFHHQQYRQGRSKRMRNLDHRSQCQISQNLDYAQTCHAKIGGFSHLSDIHAPALNTSLSARGLSPLCAKKGTSEELQERQELQRARSPQSSCLAFIGKIAEDPATSGLVRAIETVETDNVHRQRKSQGKPSVRLAK